MTLHIKVPNNTIELEIIQEFKNSRKSKSATFLYSATKNDPKVISLGLSYHNIHDFNNDIFNNGNEYILQLNGFKDIKTNNNLITIQF